MERKCPGQSSHPSLPGSVSCSFLEKQCCQGGTLTPFFFFFFTTEDHFEREKKKLLILLGKQD